MKKPPLSWSMRFALALSAVFATGTVVAGGLSYFELSHELSQRLLADVRSTAQSLAHTANHGDATDLAEQIAAITRAVPDGAERVGFVDAATGQAFGNLPVARPFTGARVLVVGVDVPPLNTHDDNQPDSYVAYGVQTRLGWVVAARDESWVTASSEIIVQVTAWALGVALALSFGMALVIARRNEHRVEAMEDVLESVGAGQLNRRINDAGSDDLAALAAQVDQMLARLEAGVGAIRQVSTDVAHDLRAPLARLRMRLEPQVLSPDVPDATRRELGSALVDLDAIAATFDAILRLARLQSNSVEHRADPVDLVALAREVHDLLEPSAADAGHTLLLDVPARPVMVTGDADLLSQALVNLADNALRHCTEPARIVIGVETPASGPVLSVTDSGPGIAPADRERVQERFVRLDASRSVPGTGLGLSIVAAIAKIHNARLRLGDARPGLRVEIAFPAQTAPLRAAPRQP